MLDPLCYCENNLNREISVREDSKVVLKVMNFKAVGIDKIPNKVLKTNTCIFFKIFIQSYVLALAKAQDVGMMVLLSLYQRPKLLTPEFPLITEALVFFVHVWNWVIFLDYGWFGQIILILSITSLMDDNGLYTDDRFSQNLDTCKQQTLFQ